MMLKIVFVCERVRACAYKGLVLMCRQARFVRFLGVRKTLEATAVIDWLLKN